MLSDDVMLALENLQKELISKYDFLFIPYKMADRLEMLWKIENIILDIIRQVKQNKLPRLALKSEGKMTRYVNLGNQQSRRTFNNIVYILRKLYQLICANKTITKRELYYGNIQLFKSQEESDRNILSVCQLLQVPCWQLNIHGGSKGLVAGKLTLYYKGGDRMVINPNEATLIPSNLTSLNGILSPAKWILIVEKETCFQNLLQSGALERWGECILITGKGFPDMNTIMLVRLLWKYVKVPLFVLVDPDPHGIDIMCVYRFGSSNMSRHSADLSCPSVRWLGIHPTDIKRLSIPSVPLTKKDRTKMEHMMARPYFKENPLLYQQGKAALEGNVKAEIEGLHQWSPNSLIETYIPNKISCKEYL